MYYAAGDQEKAEVDAAIEQLQEHRAEKEEIHNTADNTPNGKGVVQRGNGQDWVRRSREFCAAKQ